MNRVSAIALQRRPCVAQCLPLFEGNLQLGNGRTRGNFGPHRIIFRLRASDQHPDLAECDASGGVRLCDDGIPDQPPLGQRPLGRGPSGNAKHLRRIVFEGGVPKSREAIDDAQAHEAFADGPVDLKVVAGEGSQRGVNHLGKLKRCEGFRRSIHRPGIRKVLQCRVAAARGHPGGRIYGTGRTLRFLPGIVFGRRIDARRKGIIADSMHTDPPNLFVILAFEVAIWHGMKLQELEAPRWRRKRHWEWEWDKGARCGFERYWESDKGARWRRKRYWEWDKGARWRRNWERGGAKDGGGSISPIAQSLR